GYVGDAGSVAPMVVRTRPEGAEECTASVAQYCPRWTSTLLSSGTKRLSASVSCTTRRSSPGSDRSTSVSQVLTTPASGCSRATPAAGSNTPPLCSTPATSSRPKHGWVGSMPTSCGPSRGSLAVVPCRFATRPATSSCSRRCDRRDPPRSSPDPTRSGTGTSSPTTLPGGILKPASVAQGTEQRPSNPPVEGSNPSGGTASPLHQRGQLVGGALGPVGGGGAAPQGHRQVGADDDAGQQVRVEVVAQHSAFDVAGDQVAHGCDARLQRGAERAAELGVPAGQHGSDPAGTDPVGEDLGRTPQHPRDPVAGTVSVGWRPRLGDVPEHSGQQRRAVAVAPIDRRPRDPCARRDGRDVDRGRPLLEQQLAGGGADRVIGRRPARPPTGGARVIGHRGNIPSAYFATLCVAYSIGWPEPGRSES